MKRKSASEGPTEKKQKKVSTEDQVDEYVDEVLESPKNYNNLVVLLSSLGSSSSTVSNFVICNGLLKAFGKLLKQKAFSTDNSSIGKTETQKQVEKWLIDRYEEFKATLLERASSDNDEIKGLNPTQCITFLYKLLSIESKYGGRGTFPKELHEAILKSLLFSFKSASSEVSLEYLASEYLNNYDDLRFYFYVEIDVVISELNRSKYTQKQLSKLSERVLDTIKTIINFPKSESELKNFFLVKPEASKSELKGLSVLKFSSHKVAFQRGWQAALSLPQSREQFKTTLLLMKNRIIPNMDKPISLMDYLTDSYNSGGVISILALEGLFQLMQQYNLDYPDFFTKLYALFDESIMHVKYRSRFLRLVHLFLTSKLLPDTITASFIKRMARLSLIAPAPAIIAVIPFIYNQLKRFPSCMIMIHNPDGAENFKKHGDPFDPNEPNPLHTRAIESSLWELETLQNHYHPNVATLAKIISQPFRKPQYILEHFLDGSYQDLIDSEKSRKMKTLPALDFEEI